MTTFMPCDRCGALVDAYDAQAVTMDHEGTYQRWTQGRLAYYRRHGHVTEPFLKYLCQPCFHALFPEAAQADVTAGE